MGGTESIKRVVWQHRLGDHPPGGILP